MRPYSNDLRERIVAAVERGELSLRQIARLFSVSLRDAEMRSNQPPQRGASPGEQP